MSGSRASWLALLLAAAPAAATERPLLGATLYGARGSFAPAEAIARARAEGFRLVSFVPSYPYVDLNRVDLAAGPSPEELDAAAAAALDAGMAVILKPHLDPPIYFHDYKPPAGHTWRKDVAWRGYFDLDPMCPDYREGIVLRSLESLARALRARPDAPPARLELGAELMNSMVYGAPRWLELLDYARRERARLGMEKRILLSYNFEHHFEMPKDVVARMQPEARAALARFIKGLDALALSQYMDLTVAMPKEARGRRKPTVDEVARAFVVNETTFVREVLRGELGLAASEVPELHVGEFGVGTGGLTHPNEWSAKLSPEQEEALARDIALGHAGLMRFLRRGRGRLSRTAVLWTVGPHFDVFGWQDPALAIPAAARASRDYLAGR